jgi:hypothetical protein
MAMTKTYGGLFQRQANDLTLYRNIRIEDLKEGFFVVVQDRLWSAASPHAPISETQRVGKCLSEAQEAIGEADKHYDDSLKAGLRPSEESF